MSWKCSCGILNNGLNKQCAGIGQAVIQVPANFKHEPITENYYDYLEWLLDTKEIREIDSLLVRVKWEILPAMGELVTMPLPDEPSGREMTEKEKTYQTFYNEEKIECSKLDITQLRERIQLMEGICFEARTRLKAATDDAAERTAKLNKSQREWISPITEFNPTPSEAINAVKKRQERKNKIEKLNESMLALGIDPAEIRKITGAIEKNATDKEIHSFQPKVVKPAPETPEEQKARIDSIVNGPKEEVKKEPIDLTKLFKF